MSVSERGYLSIGEVLGLLQEEFPDVTISKIRFLESQGLIEPERTHAGYRKFYGPDVERLRFILREQRERFLPLRVIRDRLGAHPGDGDGDGDEAVGEPAALLPFTATAGTVPSSNGDGADEHVGEADRVGTGVEVAAALVAPAVAAAASAPAPEPHVPLWLRKAPPGVQARPLPAAAEPVDAPAGESAAMVATPAAAGAVATPSDPAPVAPAVAAFETDAQFTVEELAGAADVTPSMVRELESYGLLAPRVVGRTPYYDAAALATVRLAAGFQRHGIEPRHLKVYKTFVERESALFEQVILPLAKQRNPRARAQAGETLHELASLGASMRALLMGQAVRDLEP